MPRDILEHYGQTTAMRLPCDSQHALTKQAHNFQKVFNILPSLVTMNVALLVTFRDEIIAFYNECYIL